MKRGQVAIEYLMITGFVMILLIPTIYFLFSYTNSARDDVARSQIDEIGHQIIANAESAFYFGKNSRITTKVTLPDGIDKMSLLCTYPSPTREFHRRCELVISHKGSESVFPSRVPVISPRLQVINPGAIGSVFFYNYTFQIEDSTAGEKSVVLNAINHLNVNDARASQGATFTPTSMDDCLLKGGNEYDSGICYFKGLVVVMDVK